MELQILFMAYQLVGIVIGRVFNEEITDGVIFNPILNEFYWSSKGKGSWCNNKRLRVSKRQNFIDCIIGTGIPHAIPDLS